MRKKSTQSVVQAPAIRGNLLTRGRKFSAAELHLMLLELLNDRPYHGYELIKAFNAVSHGYYSPSPGVLYPALGHLEEAGHTSVEIRGKRKRYQLSDAGRRYLDAHRAQVDSLFATLRHAARRMVWMNQAISEEAAMQATGWLPEFVEARQALKAALFTRSDADHDEQRRVTAVLRRTVAEILQQEEVLHDPDLS